MRRGISAIIIAKDEEKYIRMCLESVKWVDEIIVVDDYSTDKTVDIAKEYTDKIFGRRLDDFSDQRNFAIEKAHGEWILSLDADEVVSEKLADEIKTMSDDTLDKYNGFYIPIKHYFFGKEIKYGEWWPSYKKRLFKKGRGRWERPIHEELVVEGRAGYLKGHLQHYAYKNISEFINKTNIYTSMEVEKGNVSSNVFKILLAPPKVFIYRYILRQGFRDGTYGLIVALLMSFYAFINHAKTWEARRKGAEALMK